MILRTMPENKNVNSDAKRKQCKLCKSNVINGRICLKCLSSYHNSCATRTKSCCDEIIQEDFTQVFKTTNEVKDVTLTEEDYLKEENGLLRQIIKDKDTIINDKENIINLLNEKIISLEKSRASKQSVVQEQQCIDVIKKSTEPTSTAKSGRQTKNPVSSEINHLQPNQKNSQTKDKLGENSKKQRDTAISINQVSLGVMEAQSMLKYNEIINLNEPNPSMVNTQTAKTRNPISLTKNKTANFKYGDSKNVDNKDHNISWETVDYKAKTKAKRNLSNRPDPIKGISNTSSKLKTAQKMEFLFLSGIAPDVTKDDVMSYLEDNNLQDGCSCEKMKTKKQYYSSFRLAVPYGQTGHYLKSNLWPEGAIINHFRNLQRQKRLTANQSWNK